MVLAREINTVIYILFTWRKSDCIEMTKRMHSFCMPSSRTASGLGGERIGWVLGVNGDPASGDDLGGEIPGIAPPNMGGAEVFGACLGVPKRLIGC